jgi:hypothetical protein
VVGLSCCFFFAVSLGTRRGSVCFVHVWEFLHCFILFPFSFSFITASSPRLRSTASSINLQNRALTRLKPLSFPYIPYLKYHPRPLFPPHSVRTEGSLPNHSTSMSFPKCASHCLASPHHSTQTGNSRKSGRFSGGITWSSISVDLSGS